jgi:hypothetical protein
MKSTNIISIVVKHLYKVWFAVGYRTPLTVPTCGVVYSNGTCGCGRDDCADCGTDDIQDLDDDQDLDLDGDVEEDEA